MKTLSNTLKLYAACLFFIFLTQKSFCQETLDADRQTAKTVDGRNGKGNNSFTISVANLESIVKQPTKLSQLEKQLGNWLCSDELGYEYDNNVSVPLFQVSYYGTIRGKDYTVEADVKKTLKNRIKELKVTTILSGLKLAEFKESLHAHGYLLNEDVSEILHKYAYEKPTGNLMITIRNNSDGTCTIGVTD